MSFLYTETGNNVFWLFLQEGGCGWFGTKFIFLYFSPSDRVLRALMEADQPCFMWMHIVFIAEDSIFPWMLCKELVFILRKGEGRSKYNVRIMGDYLLVKLIFLDL